MQSVVFMLRPLAKLFVWKITDIPENPVRKVITGIRSSFFTPDEERILIPDVISKIPESIPCFNGVSVTKEGRYIFITEKSDAKNIIVAVTLSILMALSETAVGMVSKRELFLLSESGEGLSSAKPLKVSPVIIAERIWDV